MSHESEPSPDDLQFALQEVRTLLLQQILATETGLLSVAELKYRNRGEDDINEENIRYHLREMEERDIVAKEKVPSGQRVRDLPNTFFTVTDYGEAILGQANLLAESDLWREMYEQMERTEEIERIERLKRRDWDQDDEAEPVSSYSIRQEFDSPPAVLSRYNHPWVDHLARFVNEESSSVTDQTETVPAIIGPEEELADADEIR